MLNKVFKHGTGGSASVFAYMLKDPDDSTKQRKGATVLRGDVELQKKLIDSLIPKFKQQYVAGCWSFEESPDKVSEAQKREIMDGTEELMRAGLDTDRISITWIEHIDKGRLELNYIVACVDLEHGRLFQPYVHSHDQARWNAFKDIQNIKHGFTEPDDPAKARNLSQVDNLPRDVKALKEVITNELEKLVAVGLVSNRDEVKQALDDFGFTVSRETSNSISVKRPDGGRNLKFKTTTDGGLYDLNFKPSRTSAAEISRASADFRASAEQRLDSAQRVYDREFERKQNYHQQRHKKPEPKQRTAKRDVKRSYSVYAKFDGRYARTVPNPHHAVYRNRNTRNDAAHDELYKSYDRNDRELYGTHGKFDSTARASADRVNQISSEAVLDLGSDWLSLTLDSRSGYRSNDSEQSSSRATTSDIQTKPHDWGKHLLSGNQVNEQAATRSGAASTTSESRHDSSSETNNSMERARDREKGQRYSSIDAIITSIGSESSTRIKGVANSIHELKGFNEQNNNRISELVRSAEEASGFADKTNKRANQSRQQTNRTHESIVELSARRIELNETTERYNDVRRKIEPTDGVADSNRQLKQSIDEIAERNRVSSGKAEPIANELKQLIATQEQAKKAVPSRQAYSSPRPF